MVDRDRPQDGHEKRARFWAKCHGEDGEGSHFSRWCLDSSTHALMASVTNPARVFPW
jgi:hypothetical protein